MKASATPIALVLFAAAVVYAGMTIYEDKSAVCSVTLYSQSGTPIGKWTSAGRVKFTASGCSFTTDDGRSVSVGSPYVVERQR
jgi:hypothetical protein